MSVPTRTARTDAHTCEHGHAPGHAHPPPPAPLPACPPRPGLAREQERPASGTSVVQKEDSAPPRRLPKMSGSSPCSLFSLVSLLHPQGPRHASRPKICAPCCGTPRWAGRVRRRPLAHLPVRLPGRLRPRGALAPDWDMTSFPPCTCPFKSPWPGGPVPSVGLGEAGQLWLGGGALVAPRGLLEPGRCWGS